MPSFHDVSYWNTDLIVRPIGIRRFLKFVPYSQGGKVRFYIGLKDNNKTIPPIAIFEAIRLPDGSKKEKYPLMREIPFSETTLSDYHVKRLDIKGSIISVSGEGRYTIFHPESKDAIDIVNFDAKPDATIAMWVIDGLIVVVAVILGFFLGKYFG